MPYGGIREKQRMGGRVRVKHGPVDWTQTRIGANEPAKSRPCCPSVRAIDETGWWTLALLIHFLKSLEKSKTTVAGFLLVCRLIVAH